MEFRFEYIVFALFVLVVGAFIYRMLKHGGFKAAMLGAGINRTLGEVSGDGPKLMSLSLKVHELDSSPDRAIGLELVSKSFASYQMTPIALSVSEAKKLSELINNSTSDK